MVRSITTTSRPLHMISMLLTGSDTLILLHTSSRFRLHSEATWQESMSVKSRSLSIIKDSHIIKISTIMENSFTITIIPM